MLPTTQEEDAAVAAAAADNDVNARGAAAPAAAAAAAAAAATGLRPTPFEQSFMDEAKKSLRPGMWLNDAAVNLFIERLYTDGSSGAAANGMDLRGALLLDSHFLGQLERLGPTNKSVCGQLRVADRRRRALDRERDGEAATRTYTSPRRVFVPIHTGGAHWSLAVIWARKRSVVFYDSLWNGGDDRGGRFCTRRFKIGMILAHWFIVLFGVVEGSPSREDVARRQRAELREWKVTVDRRMPQQPNGFDCGVYMLNAMTHLLRWPNVDAPEDETLFRTEAQVLTYSREDIVRLFITIS